MPPANRFCVSVRNSRVGRLRPREQLHFSVEAVKPEVVLRELGLEQQPGIPDVRRRDSAVAVLAVTPRRTAPQRSGSHDTLSGSVKVSSSMLPTRCR